ncbi:hypothetical protein [Holdemanella biformis]|uniref:hypothetical protein n=1 Tax=Holdemanella biformis TaxID=1735 RepID=UPI003A93E2D3
MLLNNLLKNTLNKKIRYAICIALLLNCWNMYAIHKTTYNITTIKEITNTKFLSTWQRLRR